MSDDEKLWAYLDRELDSVQAEVIEREIDKNEYVRQKLAQQSFLSESLRAAMQERSDAHQVRLWDALSVRIQERKREKRFAPFLESLRNFGRGFVLTPQFALGVVCGVCVLSVAQIRASGPQTFDTAGTAQVAASSEIATAEQPPRDVRFVSTGRSGSSLEDSQIDTSQFASSGVPLELRSDKNGAGNFIRLPGGRVVRTMPTGYLVVPKGALPREVSNGNIEWLRSQKRVRILTPPNGEKAGASAPIIWVSRK